MIDLHIHLDGSISVNSAMQLASVQNIMLPSTSPITLKGLMTVRPSCKSLDDYLKCFELPLSILQSPLAVKLAMRNLLVELGEIGLSYAEIRLAPQLHTMRGAKMNDIISAAIAGIEDYYYRLGDGDGLYKASIILCCMRGEANYESNLETIELAAKYMSKGVVAVDLAGNELKYPTRDYIELFSRARELNVPFTIHAGEAAGVDSIFAAVEMGASRIGHGVRAIESRELVHLLSDKRIPLELCPTSNLQTKAVKSIKDYPLKEFLDYGIIATINSDNLTVSNTNIIKEFSQAKGLRLSANDIAQLGRNAVSAAFMTQEERKSYTMSIK